MLARAALAFASVATLVAIAAAVTPSCSLGTGSGYVTGTLNAADCWSGPFNLQPDFFAAIPYRNQLELRIQNGGDFETFSDGVVILVDDITKIRPSSGNAGLYEVPLSVGLPPEVTPPGVPIMPTANPPIVHLTLYLQRTCRTQNPALYAVDAVTLNASGNCDARDDAGGPVIQCAGSGIGAPDGGAAVPPGGAASDGGAVSDGGAIVDGGGSASGPVGRSVMVFHSLFNGNAEEVSAAERHNIGDFKVYLADPREICPGGLGPPPPCRGYLEGHFDFYFERGRPAQPFP